MSGKAKVQFALSMIVLIVMWYVWWMTKRVLTACRETVSNMRMCWAGNKLCCEIMQKSKLWENIFVCQSAIFVFAHLSFAIHVIFFHISNKYCTIFQKICVLYHWQPECVIVYLAALADVVDRGITAKNSALLYCD